MTATHTPRGVPLIPIPDRPAFARRMVAAWRLHHLAAGNDLTVLVWPDEWPHSHDRAVKGVPVVEDGTIGGPGSLLVLGKARGTWRFCCGLATSLTAGMDSAIFAVTCAYGEVRDDGTRVWLAPSPATGEVPVWLVPKAGAR